MAARLSRSKVNALDVKEQHGDARSFLHTTPNGHAAPFADTTGQQLVPVVDALDEIARRWNVEDERWQTLAKARIAREIAPVSR